MLNDDVIKLCGTVHNTREIVMLARQLKQMQLGKNYGAYRATFAYSVSAKFIVGPLGRRNTERTHNGRRSRTGL